MGFHANGAFVTVKQLGLHMGCVTLMLCYNALQLVFCAEIISSPLLAQDSIRVVPGLFYNMVAWSSRAVFCFAFSIPGCSSARLEGTGTKSRCIKYSPRKCCQTLTRMLLRFIGRHRFVTFDRDRTVKSCPMAQNCSTCESHVNESQRLRMLDHHLSRMTRTNANWVVIALYGKGKWNQMLLFRESGKVLAGLDPLFLGHFGSNDC